jgi:hypothetical protein
LDRNHKTVRVSESVVAALGQRVRHTLGDEAYHDALRRAMTVALGQGQPVDPDSLAGEAVRIEDAWVVGRLSGTILVFETLLAGPRLQQRAIDGEILKRTAIDVPHNRALTPRRFETRLDSLMWASSNRLSRRF